MPAGWAIDRGGGAGWNRLGMPSVKGVAAAKMKACGTGLLAPLPLRISGRTNYSVGNYENESWDYFSTLVLCCYDRMVEVLKWDVLRYVSYNSFLSCSALAQS